MSPKKTKPRQIAHSKELWLWMSGVMEGGRIGKDVLLSRLGESANRAVNDVFDGRVDAWDPVLLKTFILRGLNVCYDYSPLSIVDFRLLEQVQILPTHRKPVPVLDRAAAEGCATAKDLLAATPTCWYPDGPFDNTQHIAFQAWRDIEHGGWFSWGDVILCRAQSMAEPSGEVVLRYFEETGKPTCSYGELRISRGIFVMHPSHEGTYAFVIPARDLIWCLPITKRISTKNALLCKSADA